MEAEPRAAKEATTTQFTYAQHLGNLSLHAIKEPNRRQTACGLPIDVKWFLTGEPLTGSKPLNCNGCKKLVAVAATIRR